jgi:hypothetical protein
MEFSRKNLLQQNAFFYGTPRLFSIVFLKAALKYRSL